MSKLFIFNSERCLKYYNFPLKNKPENTMISIKHHVEALAGSSPS